MTPNQVLAINTVKDQIRAATTSEQRDRLVVEWLEAFDFGVEDTAELGLITRDLIRAVADWRRP